MSLVKALGRSALRAWGRTGRAIGYHYHLVERFGPKLAEASPLPSRLPNGCQVRCDLRDEVQRQIWFYGAYEHVSAFLFCRLLRSGMTVIDAGANAGQYTMLAATAVGPRGQVHSFEPIPDTFARVERDVRANRLDNVLLNRAALWHEEAKLSLGNTEAATPGAESYNSGAFRVGAASAQGGAIEARGLRLDAYLTEHGVGHVDVIKMDIEGAEPFALAGAKTTLERDHPVLLIEVNRAALQQAGSGPAALWKLLSALDYRAWKIGLTPATSGFMSDFESSEQDNVFLFRGNLPEPLARDWTLRESLRWARSGLQRVAPPSPRTISAVSTTPAP